MTEYHWLWMICVDEVLGWGEGKQKTMLLFTFQDLRHAPALAVSAEQFASLESSQAP